MYLKFTKNNIFLTFLNNDKNFKDVMYKNTITNLDKIEAEKLKKEKGEIYYEKKMKKRRKASVKIGHHFKFNIFRINKLIKNGIRNIKKKIKKINKIKYIISKKEYYKKKNYYFYKNNFFENKFLNFFEFKSLKNIYFDIRIKGLFYRLKSKTIIKTLYYLKKKKININNIIIEKKNAHNGCKLKKKRSI